MHSESSSAGGFERLVLTALVVGIILVLPTYGMLRTTTDPGLWASFGGFVGVTVALAVVAQLVVPRGAALALLTTGGYVVVVLIALRIVASMGDPPAHGPVALLAGLPAAAIATLVAVVVHVRTEADWGATIVPVGLVLLIGLAVAPQVGNALSHARADAELADELAATTVLPLLPDIDGLEPSVVGRILRDDRVVGYVVEYRTDPDRSASSRLTLRNTPSDAPGCDYPLSQRCDERDGYYVIHDDRGVKYVVDTVHGLFVEYSAERAGLPDPDEVGAALRDADTVEWTDLAGIG